MSAKYFCDICESEISLYKRIHVLGPSTKIDTLCDDCWSKTEKILLSKIDSSYTKI